VHLACWSRNQRGPRSDAENETGNRSGPDIRGPDAFCAQQLLVHEEPVEEDALLT
jgi:hypothetical protein